MNNLGFEEEEGIKVVDELNIEKPTIFNIIPKEGLYLGLDISKNSTGIAYIENGEYIGGNIVLDKQTGVHKEVLLRRNLKGYLEELVKGKEFDVIVIEDAFVGDNPEVVRLLFALNTAIDELLLDGICSCKSFIRVNNQQWKSWLYTIDDNGISKGYKDKEKIKICLDLLGVQDEGDGYQDRLDSLGMVIGYFLKGNVLDTGNGLEKHKKVRLSDIEASYELDTSYIFYGRDDIPKDKIVYLDYKKFSKTRVLELLTESPDSVFMSSNVVLLGNLGIDLGLDLDEVGEEGGYFAFWIKRNKLKKYMN